MAVLPNVDPVQSQSKFNMFLDLRLILKLIQIKDPEIAKRILKKKQVEGFRDIYIVIKPKRFRHCNFGNRDK